MKAIQYLLALGVSLVIAPVLSGARRDIGPVLFPAHAAEETTAEMLAAHIRRQGYRCDGPPLSAVRDAERSKPDEAVWVLKCTNVTYRLTLIPDMAWKVEQLE
jgi:hypothetical protein